jgi:proliferating cell nuclear antigen
MTATDEFALFAKTSQASAVKSLIDVLKDLLEDVCLEFDHDGVRLVSPDSTHIAMIHLKLDSDSFDEYHCPQPITVGINIIRTFKLIKSISSSDTLAFFVDDVDSTSLGIKVENGERRTNTTFEIAMMDIKGANIDLPPIEFDSCISLPSSDLQKIIRDMSSIADRVEVKNLPDRLELTCNGDFCSQETVLEESSRFTTKSHGATEIIQGVFNLQYLAIFCKCSALCPIVEINLKNDYPIVLKYSVASLGDLKLCLSPMED